jgi:eukaryotic-like serine/threonine-protein kinase
MGTRQPWEENWTLENALGRGGQGSTHLVISKSAPDRYGALKRLNNNKSVQARGRMRTEVISLEVLSSIGGKVPKVLEHNTRDYKDTTTQLYVIMEYVDGRTLRQVVESEGPLPLERAISVILEICDTIRMAHSQSILHRDLKPENVIVRALDPPDVVVVDYGLSFNSESECFTQTEETFRNQFLDLPETNTEVLPI